MSKKNETLRILSSKILEKIFRLEKCSRTHLSDSLGLTPATVTNTLTLLINDNRVIETGDEFRTLQGSGRSRRLIKINPEFHYFIGIEINTHGIFLVVTNTIGEIVPESKQSLHEYNIENINQVLIDMIQKTLQQFSHLSFGAIGVAVPAHFDEETGRIISNNKKWKHFLLSELKKTIDLPFYLENNIKCMALGEYLFYSHVSPDKYLFIHIGPGLFCSFFDAEHILSIKNFYIGEIGHTVVNPNGPSCECGKRGCLQTYISDTWLIQSAAFLLKNAQSTIIKTLVSKPEEITLDVIYNAYILGDPFIIEKIESGISYLATSIANTLIIYDSKKIYINSQLLNYPGFSEKLIKLIKAQLQFIPTTNEMDIEILPVNPYRGAIGAAALSVYRNFICQL